MEITSTEAWLAFVEMRKASGRRAPFTEAARTRILFKLRQFQADGQDAEEVLWTSVENGWSGVFPIQRKGWQPVDKTTTVSAPSDYERTQRLLQEADRQRKESLQSKGIRRVA